MKTAKEIMTKARANLVLEDHPFFAMIAMKLLMVETNQIPTMATDGKKILYSPDFVKKLNIPEVIGTICHEVLHVVYFHHLRVGDRDRKKFNYAADYAINPIIKEAGLSLPAGCLDDPKYHNKTAEVIYNLLPDDYDKNGGNLVGNVTVGKGPDGRSLTKSEIKEAEAEIKGMIAQAAQAAKRAGSLPGNLKRLIEGFLEPEIPWRSVLARFLTESVKNDYSWSYPNQRYVHMGLYLPALNEPTIGNIVQVMDTSGSISQKEMNLIAKETKGILNAYDTEITVMYCDSKVQGEQEFDRYSDLKLDPKGGGGTDFIPAFSAIEEHEKDFCCIIYLTDGYCNSFPDNIPDVPTLWVLTEDHNKEWEPPFGETINLGQ